MDVAYVSQTRAPSPLSNYFSGAKFSPDGLCLLTSTTGDNTLELYEPTGAALQHSPAQGEEPVTMAMQPLLRSPESSTIYDYCWYPNMDSSNPASCVYLSTSRDQPLHLWDAYNGKLRASYVGFDQNDEVWNAYCVAFSGGGGAGERIYAGYVNEVKIFRTDLPGRTSISSKTVTCKKSRNGQRGIISAIAASDAFDQVWAAGSYSGSIYLYDDRTARNVAEFAEAELPVSSVRTMEGMKVNSNKNRKAIQNGDMNLDDMMASVKNEWYEKNVNSGITQLKWGENTSEYSLFSSSRRGDGIVVWDMRMLTGGETGPTPVRAFARDGDTNQTLQFDLKGDLIFVGSKDKAVKVYGIETGTEIQGIVGFSDACNGVSVSPVADLLAVATGQRHYPMAGGGGDESDSSGEDDMEEQEQDEELGGTLSVLKYSRSNAT